ELTDAVAALTRELHADDRAAADRLPRPPWPPTAAPTPEPPEHAAPASAAPIVATPEPHAAPESAAPTVPTPEPTWSRIEGEGAAAPSPAAAQADAAQTAGDTAAPADAAQTAGGTAAPADADRAGGAAEDDFATPLAKSPRAARSSSTCATGWASPSPSRCSTTSSAWRPTPAAGWRGASRRPCRRRALRNRSSRLPSWVLEPDSQEDPAPWPARRHSAATPDFSSG